MAAQPERSTPRRRVSFTMQRCESLPCPRGAERLYYHDTQTPGLCLCVTSTGTRTFFVCRRVRGKPTRIKLGRLQDLSLDRARKEAQRVNGEVALGKDPQAIKRAARAEATFQELFDFYLDRHAKVHKKTWNEDERQYRKYLTAWKGKKLSEIRKADVQALHAKLGKDNGPYQANRVLSLLHTMFGKAPDLGWTGGNPAHGVRKFKERSRERFLQGDELPKFFQALEQEENATLRDYFKVSLFTGARRGNIQAMRWDQLHLDRGTWVIPDTKSGQAVTVALVPAVVELLEARHSKHADSPWVFASYGKSGHLVEPKGAWKRLLARAGIADLRLHDLRRTLGSWQAAQGTSLTVIGKSLGHKSTSTTAVYARLDLNPVREAVTAAAAAMLAAGQKQEAKPSDGADPAEKPQRKSTRQQAR